MSKKIIYTIMIIAIILSYILLPQNKTKAVSREEKIELCSKGEVVRFSYDGEPVSVNIIYAKVDGKEYPAYGLKEKDITVSNHNSYSVTLSDQITNQRVWKAITNGFPFKTPEEMGLDTYSRDEAYAATKIAVYDAICNYDLDKFTQYAIDSTNRETIAAAKRLIEKARSSETPTKIVANLTLSPENEAWQVDSINKNYISKTYTVTASAENETYSVSLSGKNTSKFKVTDINNEAKEVFNSNEKFKVLVPIIYLEKPGEFNINLSSSLKTMPIFCGKGPDDEHEDFAIILGDYEEFSTAIKQTYEENKTKIKVIKQDGDTKLPLQGAEFNLLDENKSILYSQLVTNKEGIMELPNIMPGNYYLEEVKPPTGYYGYSELIPVELEFQKASIITIDNFKEEEKIVPESPVESHYTPTKKLPATGF